MKYYSLLSILFLLSCNIKDPVDKSIMVCGEGKIRVKPDIVTLTLNVNFTQPRMADAVRLTQHTVDSVLMILNNYGNDSDIKTSSISANKQYMYVGNKEVFSGYQASQTIDFVLKDLKRFTELTGKILETKISSIANLQFGHSKADSLFREADLLAYDDAIQSANKLCKRANVNLGKILYISNSSADNDSDNEGYSSGQRINTFSKAYGGRGFKIAPEVLEFKRIIISKYEIN